MMEHSSQKPTHILGGNKNGVEHKNGELMISNSHSSILSGPSQESIRQNCRHPHGTFVEFNKEEENSTVPVRFEKQVKRHGERVALHTKKAQLTYNTLNQYANRLAHDMFQRLGKENEPVALLFEQGAQQIVALLGTLKAGKIYVPIDPTYPHDRQVFMLEDSQAAAILTDKKHHKLARTLAPHLPIVNLDSLDSNLPAHNPESTIGPDSYAYILYTSGSTGKPKGVVLSHKNMVTGAFSVSEYLENTPDDKLLAVLPFSFDYGFSQLSTAFCRGASVVLMEYLMPNDVIKKVAAERITGLAGVPPLWNQLAALEWPEEVTSHLRYITNSGGAMPKVTLGALRSALPKTNPYLMYGLTEAFRSTYLPPEQIDQRPESMGKAIPNAEIMVVTDEGKLAAPGETGELVHRGSLVSLGYWNSPEKTAEPFKPVPSVKDGLVMDEIAVWSGDRVRIDDEGYLFFVGRRDEMIKTSGYRVSPNEVEEGLFSTGLVSEAVALGAADDALGQAIAVVVMPAPDGQKDTDALMKALRQELANFMLPKHVIWLDDMPRNANGKIDRSGIAKQLPELLKDAG